MIHISTQQHTHCLIKDTGTWLPAHQWAKPTTPVRTGRFLNLGSPGLCETTRPQLPDGSRVKVSPDNLQGATESVVSSPKTRLLLPLVSSSHPGCVCVTFRLHIKLWHNHLFRPLISEFDYQLTVYNNIKFNYYSNIKAQWQKWSWWECCKPHSPSLPAQVILSQNFLTSVKNYH